MTELVDININVEGISIPVKVHPDMLPTNGRFVFRIMYNLLGRNLSNKEAKNFHAFVHEGLYKLAKAVNEQDREGWL